MNPNYNAINNLKWMSSVLRCLLHASVPYIVTKNFWPVNETPGLLFFDVLIFNIHSFIMELFFILAGYASVRQYYKLSLMDYFNNRMKRVFIPFIIGVLILMPLIICYFSIAELHIHTILDFAQNIDLIINNTKNLIFSNHIPIVHLWFLYYLILFYVCFIIIEKAFSFTKKIDLNNYNPYWVLIIIAVLTSTCMFFMRRWFVDNPLSFIVELPSFIHYFIFFMLGTILINADKFVDSLKKQWKKNGILSVCLMIIAISCQYYYTHTEYWFYPVIKFTGIVSHSLLTVFALYTLIGLFHSKYNYTNQTFKLLYESSYWTYLLFVPSVMLMHMILYQIEINIIIKYIISLSVSFAFCIATYHYIVKKTFLANYVGFKNKIK